MNSLLLATGETFWMPPQASTFARGIDNVFYFILVVCAVFFIIIAACMFAFMVLYRDRGDGKARSQLSHNTPIEIAWSVLPSLLLVPMFWWGYTEFKHTRLAPANTFDVNVEARKWDFSFTYPSGLVDEDLHVVVNRPTKLIMRSQDVIHAAFIPAFRVKRDIVPSRYSEVWFQPTMTGEFVFTCAEYCGTSHSDMNAKLVVHANEAELLDWIKNADPINGLPEELWKEYEADPAKFLAKYGEGGTTPPPDEHKAKIAKIKPPAVMGDMLRTKKGCVSCHSIDGTVGTGPTWKGMWGHKVEFIDGSVFDSKDDVEWANYVRESILNPHKRIVKGFGPNMSLQVLTDREIDCIIAYMKTLKD